MTTKRRLAGTDYQVQKLADGRFIGVLVVSWSKADADEVERWECETPRDREEEAIEDAKGLVTKYFAHD